VKRLIRRAVKGDEVLERRLAARVETTRAPTLATAAPAVATDARTETTRAPTLATAAPAVATDARAKRALAQGEWPRGSRKIDSRSDAEPSRSGKEGSRSRAGAAKAAQRAFTLTQRHLARRLRQRSPSGGQLPTIVRQLALVERPLFTTSLVRRQTWRPASTTDGSERSLIMVGEDRSNLLYS
jgi:hypothetical protein